MRDRHILLLFQRSYHMKASTFYYCQNRQDSKVLLLSQFHWQFSYGSIKQRPCSSVTWHQITGSKQCDTDPFECPGREEEFKSAALVWSVEKEQSIQGNNTI